MKPKLLLRIASLLMLWHAVGHSIGIATWDQAATPVMANVVTDMKAHAFPFFGAVHSYADSFTGFGYSVTIFLLLLCVLLWVTSSSANSPQKPVPAIILFVSISLFALGALEVIDFFPVAYITSFLAALLTGMAYLSMKKRVVA